MPNVWGEGRAENRYRKGTPQFRVPSTPWLYWPVLRGGDEFQIRLWDINITRAITQLDEVRCFRGNSLQGDNGPQFPGIWSSNNSNAIVDDELNTIIGFPREKPIMVFIGETSHGCFQYNDVITGDDEQLREPPRSSGIPTASFVRLICWLARLKYLPHKCTKNSETNSRRIDKQMKIDSYPPGFRPSYGHILFDIFPEIPI
jgi:hypothetical protein